MLNLPVPPPTRITRQLTCVSCKEKFFVSEDDPIRNIPISDNWQVPITDASDVQLRYQEERAQRSVKSDTHSRPQRLAFNTWRNQRRDHISCPRCGADNRNWLNLLNPIRQSRQQILKERFLAAFTKIVFSFVFSLVIWLFANTSGMPAPHKNLLLAIILIGNCLPIVELIQQIYWRNLTILISQSRRGIWSQRFPAAFRVVIFSVVLLLIVFIAWSNTNISGMSTPRKITLLAFILIAAVLPALDLTKQSNWLDLRNDRHLRRIGQANSANVEIGLWFRGFMLFLICTFIVPVVIFLYGPRGISFLTRIFIPPPAAIVENAAAPYINMLNKQLNGMPDDVADLTYDTIRRLEDIPYPWAYASAIEGILDEFNQDLEEILTDLADSTQPDTLHQITALQTAVDQAMLEINRAQNDEAQKAIAETSGTIRFLALWVMLVGVSSIASVFASMAALKGFTGHVDSVLPPPIFYSVANMTRVVVWEAKQALEIKVAVEHIQWTAVNRNEHGGITLQGLHYDSNLPHPVDNTLTTRVLAQRYEIISDLWGRIIEAKVKPTRALLPSRGSTLGDELFHLPPHVPMESRWSKWP